jgi:Protein of unknown function (DUF1403)/Reverse transcriptase (RNA-dependent DNA polymerase)
VPHLIKMWLECPVAETDKGGRKTQTTEAKDNRRGIPQGSPISPSLANLYMRRFDLGWKKRGLEQSLGTRIVTYADDQLRGRDAARRIEILLTEDAQAATAGASATDRSSRRLFDRLVAIGAARELTGRPTFRLYGL